MVNRVPWGEPYDRWTLKQLQDGLRGVAGDEYFPQTEARLREEIAKHN